MIFPFLIYSLQVYLGMIGRMINDTNFWKSCKTQRYKASLILNGLWDCELEPPHKSIYCNNSKWPAPLKMAHQILLDILSLAFQSS